MLETVVEQGSSRTSIGCFSRKVTKQELGGNSGMKQRDLVNGLDSMIFVCYKVIKQLALGSHPGGAREVGNLRG